MAAPSRHRARTSEPAADLLTSLPPPLLDCILTRLDLCDAVLTSALSRAWRRRWEALPYLPLFLLNNPGTPPVAVDRVLVRYPGNISSFSFQLNEHSVGRVADWLIALCSRGVQSMNLQFPFPSTLHSSVFLCTQLVYLELHKRVIPPLPIGFTGFPVLKDLKLGRVKFPDNGEKQLEAILAASPMLDTLNLFLLGVRDKHADTNVWTIVGANLRILTIVGDCGWQAGELPCLDEATVDVGNYFPAGGLLDTLPCTFDNLRSLALSTHFYEMPSMSLTFSLLRNAPILEELEITIEEDDEDEIGQDFLNTQWTDAFCANLQVVKMKDIGWLPNEMYFIELVLSKAIVLRTMYLSVGSKSSKSNEDALSELMTYRRASPRAQVFFGGKKP
ncbi:hypothetical protein ACQ4PT_035993 [Festuca glaucescens]